jgi:hypothetical protein
MTIIHSARPKHYKNKEFLAYTFNMIRKIFKGYRFEKLSIEVENQVSKINKILKKKTILLDYGCGSMYFSTYLCKKKIIKKATCVDTYNFNLVTKKNIKYFTINELEKKRIKRKYFDVAIMIDVLHHVGIDQSHVLLKKVSKISKFILIKDHFEHGFFSRHLLRFVDFFGNYAYGVNIPKKYFDNKTWKQTIKKSSLNQITFKKNFQQHEGLFNLILHRKHHFISVLK